MFKRSCGNVCAVNGCSNSYKTLRVWKEMRCDEHKLLHMDCPCLIPFKLHRFPKNEEQRRNWIAKLNRKNFVPNAGSVVCSYHFIDGRPTQQNPYPQLHLGYNAVVKPGRRPLARHEQLPKPSKRRKLVHTKKTSAAPNEEQNAEPACPDEGSDTQTTSEGINENEIIQLNITEQHCCTCTCGRTKNPPSFKDQGMQWEDQSLSDHNYGKTYPSFSFNTDLAVSSQQCQTTFPSFSVELLSENDFKFYTSLNKILFLQLVQTLLPFSVKSFKLPFPDQVLLVLMRLRLGLLFQDLAWRFQISTSTASKIFFKNIRMMCQKLHDLIVWLPRETIKLTMPTSFKEKFPGTTCIIDCTEIFVQRPNNLKARAQSFSRYKSHNTLKLLAAIAPNGLFMFVSDCYGGRASDKFIALNSGFMNYLEPGDEVMADRGFCLEPELNAVGVKLNVPAFTKGKSQLSEKEVTTTRKIASVRIDVERAFWRFKVFRIFQSPISINVQHTIDEMIKVCIALCNLQPPLTYKD